MKGRDVFLDIDTQADFMLPEGALYVKGAEQIVDNLRRLMEFARMHGIPVLSSADAHSADDPSFAQWPPHCVVGTAGQRRIPETQFIDATVVPRAAGVFRPPASHAGQIIIEKTDYDIWSNPNIEAVLAWLDPRRFVAFGVATEYCVRSSVLSLRNKGFAVDLVLDAIRQIAEGDGRAALEQMQRAGVRPVTTAEVVSGLKASAK
jgi:nicotinamidase/pyrazinamidase